MGETLFRQCMDFLAQHLKARRHPWEPDLDLDPSLPISDVTGEGRPPNPLQITHWVTLLNQV